jgi:hypothetical protein
MNRADMTTALIVLSKKSYLPDSTLNAFNILKVKYGHITSLKILLVGGTIRNLSLWIPSKVNRQATLYSSIIVSSNMILISVIAVQRRKMNCLNPPLFVVNFEGNHVSLGNYHKSQNNMCSSFRIIKPFRQFSKNFSQELIYWHT